MPKSLYFQRPDIVTSQDLTADPLSYTTSISSAFRVSEVTVHFSVAVTETITITKDSAKGSNYDTVKVNRSMVSEQDFVYRPQGDADYQAGDNLKIAITNANVTGTAYVTIKTSELGSA